ncbi:MAG: hypothetical protein Q8M95_07240 [Candidatus Methanoperedens sp.]|nr:hypothetical protein [Candidatus Methanoperedens sp.]
MKRIKTLLLVAMVLTAVTAVAVAGADDSVSSATDVITSYSNNNVTRDAVKTELSNKYVSGTLTKADLKKVITAAYNRNLLKRDDLRWLLGEMYKEGKLTKADMKFLITEAYKAGELKRDDVAWIITHAYKNGELTRDDMKWLIVEAYKAGELTRDDIRRIIIVSYNHRELTRDDMKWLLMQAYKNNELTREDIRLLITAAYRQGELTRADVKWLIVEGYKARELTRDDLRWILLEAIKRGELRKTDVVWIVNEGYKANELTTSDITEAEVNSAPVDSEPAYVPTVETITEPNAETASEATTAKTFDEESTPASAESVIKTKQAWMLYKYALLPMEKHRIGMEALIGYVESLGKDASKLVTLKEKFVSLADQLRTAAEKNDYQGGRRIISQMKDTGTSFRTETKLLIAGNEAGARDALNSALEANSDYFDSLVTEAREARKNRNLEFFDLALARAQGRLDKAKEKGVDVSALQAKLDEISSLRSAFVDAMNEGIAACDGEGIGRCTKPEVEAFKTVREEIKNKYRELVELAKTTGQSQRFANAIRVARDIISKSETVLDGFEKRGVDVSAEKAGLDEIKGLVDSAETKYKAGDYTGAQQDLKKAQEMFKDIRSKAVTRRNTR